MSGPLGEAATNVLTALAAALTPPPDTSISEWVETGAIYLSEKTNTPKPGTLTFDGVEYLREPIDRLHPDDPATRITIRGGAQSAKSTVGQVWVCWSVENAPRSFAIGLPSAGEMTKYNDLKLEPLLDDSERLRDKVDRRVIRGKPMSDSKKKTLVTGATLRLFNLASPKELQMISTGNLILEEVGNAQIEVGTRGSPIAQARERQAAYSVVGSKELMVSTPSNIGECEVTTAEEAGDRRRFFGVCPNCSGYLRLEPEGFRIADLNGTPNHFVCPPAEGGCGGVLEEIDMHAFRTQGAWVPTFTSENPDANPAPGIYIAPEDLEAYRNRDCEGREPSYYIWQAYCGLISWNKIAKTIKDAKKPAELKALEQQTYGRAWDPSVDTIGWEDLHRLREQYEHHTVPSGAEVVTAFTDVQGSYLEGGAIAWGPGGEWWIVDRWVIQGDTAGDEVWFKLDEIYRRTYAHADGGFLPIEAFGVDTGYRTQRVYSFCRGRPNSFAMDGRPGWKLPLFGKPSMQKVIERGRVKGRVKLWPTGTWELKSMLSWSLTLSIEAGYAIRQQGRGHWTLSEDEAWAQQITAEGLIEETDKRTGTIHRMWKKLRERNEWVDIWVGARALAWNLGVGAPAKDGRPEATDWAQRAIDRRGDATAPADLFEGPNAPAAKPQASATEAPPADAPVVQHGHTDEPGSSRGRFYKSRRR